MLVVEGYCECTSMDNVCDLSGGSETSNIITTLGQYMQYFHVPSLTAD